MFDIRYFFYLYTSPAIGKYSSIKPVIKMKDVFAFRYALIIAAISILTVSCNDDDEKSKTDLLTAKSWRNSKMGLKLNGADEVDVTDKMEPCFKDDVNSFKKDGVFHQQEGSNICVGAKAEATGTWSWKENETILSIEVDGLVSDVTVVTLTGTTLKIDLGTETFDVDGDGTEDEVKFFYTLVH
jgi:hypothetical protein